MRKESFPSGRPQPILVRGVEYSPLGLLKSLTFDLNQDRTGTMEAYEAIDMLTGLSDKGWAYLWQSTNKGWKADNNPYK